jgi:hypothetical protein
MFLVWWYKSKPVFWLPKGWLPYPLVWMLSFPSAPLGMSLSSPLLARQSCKVNLTDALGSVSPLVWSTACQYAFTTMKDIAQDLLLTPNLPAPGQLSIS